jgi:hypothetical protein
LSFSLGAGLTYSGTAGAWAGENYWSATGATPIVGTSGATFYITGVQLEEGTVPTPFEHRPYGVELALCQRYYTTGQISGVVGYASGRYSSFTYVNFSVEMRATPMAYVEYGGTVGGIRNNNTGSTLTGYTAVEGTNKYITCRNPNTDASSDVHYSTTFFAEAEL